MSKSEIVGDDRLCAIWRESNAAEDEWARPELEKLRLELRKSRRILGYSFFAICLFVGMGTMLFGERDIFVITVGVVFTLLSLPFLYVGYEFQKDKWLNKLVPQSNRVLEVRIPIERKWFMEPDEGGIAGTLLQSPCGRRLLFYGRGYTAGGVLTDGGVFPGQSISIVHYFVKLPEKHAPILALKQSMQLCVVVHGHAESMESIDHHAGNVDLELMINLSQPVSVDGKSVFRINATLGSLSCEEVLRDMYEIADVIQSID